MEKKKQNPTPPAQLKALGARVRQLRKAQGLTQKQLGDMIGSTDRYISKIENARCSPSAKYLFRLAEALGCGAWELFVSAGDAERMRAA